MKTHRLFPCLFPVLAVATLLPSASFAPGTPPREFGEETSSSQGAIGGGAPTQLNNEPASLSSDEELQSVRVQRQEERARNADLRAQQAAAHNTVPENPLGNLLSGLLTSFANSGDGRRFAGNLRDRQQETPGAEPLANLFGAAFDSITINGQSLSEMGRAAQPTQAPGESTSSRAQEQPGPEARFLQGWSQAASAVPQMMNAEGPTQQAQEQFLSGVSNALSGVQDALRDHQDSDSELK